MDYHDLIPEIRAWEEHNKHAFDPADWIECIGSFEHAIGYAWLFWPSFVVHDDCILGEGFAEDTYRGFLDQAKGDKSAVEAVMNHVHIAEMFSASDKRPTPQQLQWLGERLRDMWDAKLKRDFPEKNVKVSFHVPEDPAKLREYELTAFQVRNAG
jgi:hypothetical protein